MDERDDLPRTNHSELITFVSDRPGHDVRYAINPARIFEELNWSPKIKWDEGFKKTINWYIENREWWEPLIDSGQFGQRLGR